jgi:dolichyl-phosphate beta-glucosyltransferase
MSRAFNLLVRALIVHGLRDTQCGFKGFQREIAHDLFSSQHIDGFSFDVEILFLARRRGYRIQEVPINWYFNAASRVHAVKDTANMACDLIRIRYRALRGTYGLASGSTIKVVEGSSPQAGEVVCVVEPILVKSKTI